ncbi:GNAT family N-acetyltransferase [Solitalea canadensis]|uniref:Acetyltransferase, ribosomal protein N-acetylase n=1 Tax=Solitalea canadensis (strain ATCC 29591 / DSM 3403 / JCM 21819 / LMG 8368 / NBRC 15130 / NCIMB 12057 / USAM 9D) TaxID=929556 RepID=H8KQ74_SOLCM|nr:GNAT family N-acetyltransferase [Solitalea canadensis]AFD06369.1 acetyltransferase, ribosomal protein N-acetylase [Solitalea canadensis DSM 3403]
MNNAPILFESDRLLFREFTPEDARGMFELNLAPEVLKFTGDAPFNSIDEARSFITNYTQYQDRGYGRWTVLLKDTNEYLGWCGLKYIPEYMDIDLGYRFLRKYWGQGMATEASKATLSYGFNHLNMDRIVGRAHVDNHASIRVLEKAGLSFEKEMEYDIGPTVQYVKLK